MSLFLFEKNLQSLYHHVLLYLYQAIHTSNCSANLLILNPQMQSHPCGFVLVELPGILEWSIARLDCWGFLFGSILNKVMGINPRLLNYVHSTHLSKQAESEMVGSTFLEPHDVLPLKDYLLDPNTLFVNICSHLASRLGMGAPRVHQVREMEQLLREVVVAADEIGRTSVLDPFVQFTSFVHPHYMNTLFKLSC